MARPAAPRRTALVAVGALTALWLWSLVSVAWAESADQALVDASRWIVYVALFGLLVLLLRDDRLCRLLIASAGLVVLALGGYLVVSLLGEGGPSLFLSKRLNEPLGYVNGQAGYLLLGVWPLIAAAERARHRFLGAGAVACATVLVGLALLGQTRAIVPAAVLSAVLLLAAVPGRRARLWALIAMAAGVSVAAGPLLDVFSSGAPGAARPDGDALSEAVWMLLAGSAGAGVVWAAGLWLSSLAERRVGRRPVVVVATAVVVIAGAAALVGAIAAIGDPVERARDEVRSFRDLGAGSPANASQSRFTSGGGNRYDYWRVAARQFRDQPVRGIGAGNYDRTYFAERQTTEDVRQPHSLGLQTLAELGVVGGLALLVFLGAVATGFLRRLRAARTSDSDLVLAVGGGGMFCVWLVHTSVDWLHLLPGVTGIALCGAAVLVAPWARAVRRPGRSPLRLAAIGACALLVASGAVFVAQVALADRYRSQARDLVATEPERALEKAQDSLSLNDESLPAYYALGAAHARLGRYELARAALVEATRREPHDFVTWALLGDLAVRRGDFAQARRDYTRASELNPRDAALERLAKDPRLALGP